MNDTSDPQSGALVVDDNAIVRMSNAQIVSDAGFRIFEGTNVDEALSILSEHHAVIRLLVTDVEMPGTRDGFALARETAARWPGVRILIASGHAHPESGDLPEGALFVDKPFSPEIVHARLKQLFP